MDRRKFLMTTAATTALGGVAACGPEAKEADTDDIQESMKSGNETKGVALDGLGLAEAIRSGQMSASDAAQASIAAIEKLNGSINAVVTPTFEQALGRADAGLGNGPFAGVPILLKDLLDYKGVRMTQGSRLMMQNISQWTSPFVEALEGAGVNILGKANTPEFGLLATTESLALGACHNPWNLEHSTGGSSGGSAAAVASGMVPFAQSSDGGGSIRIPASCCGLFGLKPSRGKMKQTSLEPTPGDIGVRHVIARSVRDSAMAHAIAEDVDANAAFAPTGNIEGPSSKRLKIAFNTKNYYGDEPDADVKAAIEETAKLCADLGHEIIEVTTPVDGELFIDRFLTIWASGPAALKAMVEEQIGKGAEETGLLEPWTLGLANYFNAKPADAMANSLAYFAQVTAHINAWFTDYDVWLSPVLKSAPPKLGEQSPEVPFDTLFERTVQYVSYTPLHNVVGTPAMSVPLHWNAAGLPIGSQFAAPLNGEATLFALAYELEAAKPWAHKWAPHSIMAAG